jgi:hypothetical protein
MAAVAIIRWALILAASIVNDKLEEISFPMQCLYPSRLHTNPAKLGDVSRLKKVLS